MLDGSDAQGRRIISQAPDRNVCLLHDTDAEGVHGPRTLDVIILT